MNGDEIGYGLLYSFVSLGTSIGSRLNRFAVCKLPLSHPPSIDPRAIGYIWLQACESVRENPFEQIEFGIGSLSTYTDLIDLGVVWSSTV